LARRSGELRSAPWLEETKTRFDSWLGTGVPVLPSRDGLRATLPAARPRSSLAFSSSKARIRQISRRTFHQNCRAKGNRRQWSRLASSSRAHAAPREFPWMEFWPRRYALHGTSDVDRIRDRELGLARLTSRFSARCASEASSVPCLRRERVADHPGPRRHPHLSRFVVACTERARQCSSAVEQRSRLTLSVLSAAVSTNALSVVAENWPVLSEVDSLTTLDFSLKHVQPLRALRDLDREALWGGLQGAQGGNHGGRRGSRPQGSRVVALRAARSAQSRDFRVNSN